MQIILCHSAQNKESWDPLTEMEINLTQCQLQKLVSLAESSVPLGPAVIPWDSGLLFCHLYYF